MGNTLAAHEDLSVVRGWNFEQIEKAYITLRRKSMMYTMNKEEFTRYIGGRHREANAVFGHLDTDYDGKVDVFEVLVVLAIWSGTSWEEKQELLFMQFDMMDKGFLKIDEVMFMGTIIIQTMNKFVKVPPNYGKLPYLKEFAQEAFASGVDKLQKDMFKDFSNDVEPFEQLRGFIEDNAARGQPPSVESRMRLQISTLEKHVNKLFERLERLQNRLPDFVESCIEYVTAWGRRKRWDFVMQNLRQLVLNLHQSAENMHTNLADLSASLKEDESNNGLSSVIEPHRRFQQEQLVAETEQMRVQSLGDFRESVELLRRLIDFTQANEAEPMTMADQASVSGMNAIQEVENENLVSFENPRVVDSRNLMKQVHSEMLAEINEGGAFSRDTEGAEALFAEAQAADKAKQEAAGGTASPQKMLSLAGPDSAPAASASTSTEIPKLIAIANFEPPATHQSQMLPLVIGDMITVIGQDGKGWWYGKKQNGTEGWFPPSYVQTKGAHFSSKEPISSRGLTKNLDQLQKT